MTNHSIEVTIERQKITSVIVGAVQTSVFLGTGHTIDNLLLLFSSVQAQIAIQEPVITVQSKAQTTKIGHRVISLMFESMLGEKTRD